MNNLQTVFDNSKTYENIAEKRAFDYPEIEKALEVVREFVVRKKRILYGGMAIDLALKASDHPGIYSKDTIPDYDFMSPDFYEDSNELAVILHKKGFTGISSINAQHVSTRRVRINYITVADITYIPPKIYKTLPFVNYQGLRIIHPRFQRLDVHRALSTPLEKPPGEVFFQRTKKDIIRFKLSDSRYPVTTSKMEINLQNKTTTIPFAIGKKPLQDYVIGGFQAYAVMKTTFDSLVKAMPGLVSKDLQERAKQIKPAVCELTAKGLNFIGYDTITLITDSWPEHIKQLGFDPKKTEYYNQFVDNWRPRTIRHENYEIFDIQGTLLPCYDLKNMFKLVSTVIDFDKTHVSKIPDNVNICAAQYVLMFWLQKHFETQDAKKKQVYLEYYISMQNMVIILEDMMNQFKIMIESSEVLERANKGTDIKTFWELYASLPFFLTSNTYETKNTKNWSPDYINFLKDTTYKLNHVPQDKQEILRPVFGFYPDKSDDWPKFDPTESSLFQIDGEKRKTPFEPLSLNVKVLR